MIIQYTGFITDFVEQIYFLINNIYDYGKPLLKHYLHALHIVIPLQFKNQY